MVTTRSRLSTAKNKKPDSEKPSSSTRRTMKRDPKQPSSSTDPETGLPVGLRFNPTDQELLDHYLQSRISLGEDFESDFVVECPDVYGETEPWEVWYMYGGDDSNKVETLYFFTQRKRTSRTSTRFDRKVGSGTWSGQNWKPVVDEEDESVVIGTKREFRYEGGRDKRHNDAWLMQEYQIDDDCDIVVCTLRKSRRNPPPAAQSSSVDQKSRLNVRKRKTDVYQPKAKRQKQEESSDEEEDGSSDDDHDVEPEAPSVDVPKMEQNSFELAQDHPMLQDCYYPEFLVEDGAPNEYVTQTPASYDGNNLNLLSNDGQVAQFGEGSGDFMALLLNS